MHVCQIFFDVRYWVSDGDGEGGGGVLLPERRGLVQQNVPKVKYSTLLQEVGERQSLVSTKPQTLKAKEFQLFALYMGTQVGIPETN